MQAMEKDVQCAAVEITNAVEVLKNTGAKRRSNLYFVGDSWLDPC